MNKDSCGNVYLVVHSGSRYLGKQVAEYYQALAIDSLTNTMDMRTKIITKLKSEGKTNDIEAELKKIKKPKILAHLAYLEGDSLEDYLHDMNIVQQYAVENRHAIVDVIVSKMGFAVEDSFTTIHNYIDVEHSILRKGAISAQLGEKVLIPINMRDGSIIAIGKGVKDWNFSAPHGAGRILSRSKAKETLLVEEYSREMSKVWSTSVKESTLDESPMAYKSMDDIIENIGDTVEIKEIISPIYNFKSS